MSAGRAGANGVDTSPIDCVWGRMNQTTIVFLKLIDRGPMKSKAPSLPLRKTRMFALALGIVLSAFLAFVEIYEHSLSPYSAEVAYAIIGGVVIGVPMLLLLLITTLYIRWKSGTFNGLGKPWLFVLLAVAILPLLLLKAHYFDAPTPPRWQGLGRALNPELTPNPFPASVLPHTESPRRSPTACSLRTLWQG